MKATMNVYKKQYDIPNDLMVRRPDREIRMSMEHSETLERVRMMAEHSIHPSLLFFEKELSDNLIE